jgi:hypothetical protein
VAIKPARRVVQAVEYPVDHVPPDEQIKDDLLTAGSWLGEIYRQSADGLDEPTSSPEATMAPGQAHSLIHHPKPDTSARNPG